jgi:hypothetical protein
MDSAQPRLPYYRKNNPIISDNARHVIREILATPYSGGQ